MLICQHIRPFFGIYIPKIRSLCASITTEFHGYIYSKTDRPEINIYFKQALRMKSASITS